MSQYYSPKIVTDNLILCLDAENPKSYPGSGNMWYDLSGNKNHGTLTDGVVLSEKHMAFPGGTSDMVVLPTDNGLNITGDLTISSWVMTTNLTDQNAIITWANSYTTFPYHHNIHTTGQIRFNGNTAGNLLSTDIIIINQWYNIVASVNGVNLNIYINGKPDSGNTHTLSLATRTVGDGYPTLSRNGSQEMIGFIDMISIYNRALTATEVKTNYLSARGRFGI